MSLRGRLLAASLALVAIGLLVAGSATYFAFRSFLVGQVDTQLRADASSVAEFAGSRRAVTPVGPIFFELLDQNDNLLQNPDNATGATPALPSTLTAPNSIATAQPFTVASTNGGRPYYRVLVAPINIQGQPEMMVLAIPLAEEAHDLERMIATEVLIGIAVLMAAAIVGSWLVRLGLKPLGAIEVTAEKIAEGNLTERIAIGDERTEVGRLAKALNTMLGRIQASFEERRRSEEALRSSEERLRQFVSDASHELRTPIAAVRANAELFRRGGQNHPEDVPRAMARIEAEAARMGLLVEDLLLLTRLDEGRPLEQAPVDLGALAADSVEAARMIEPDRPVTLRVEGSVEVVGDRDRLRQVIDNLLANVRTHTPAKAPAGVTVRLEGARAIIEVADTGPGIDPVVGAQIFERFFRADPSRARDRGGAGLGLSIVAAITAAHGGQASATNRPGGGAVFRIDLPALVEAARPEPISDADPDTADPDTADPDTADPDTADPDTDDPDTAEPGIDESGIGEPGTGEDTPGPIPPAPAEGSAARF